MKHNNSDHEYAQFDFSPTPVRVFNFISILIVISCCLYTQLEKEREKAQLWGTQNDRNERYESSHKRRVHEWEEAGQMCKAEGQEGAEESERRALFSR